VPPHFHAIYGEYEITVEIESGVINGRFPRRALRLVLEWLELHKDELLENCKFWHINDMKAVNEDSDTSKINSGNIETAGQIPIYGNVAKW
jgi:hypothetical protein